MTTGAHGLPAQAALLQRIHEGVREEERDETSHALVSGAVTFKYADREETYETEAYRQTMEVIGRNLSAPCELIRRADPAPPTQRSSRSRRPRDAMRRSRSPSRPTS